MGSLAVGVVSGGGVAPTGGDPAAAVAHCCGRGLRGGGSAWEVSHLGLFFSTFDAVIALASSPSPRVVLCQKNCTGFGAAALCARCVTGAWGVAGIWTVGTGGLGTGVPDITPEAQALIAPPTVTRV